MILLKTLVNSWYSEEILERSETFVSFAKLAWMSKEWRQSSKLLEPKNFNACKNTTESMMAMLGCLEIDIQVLDTGMETAEFNNCRKISKDNGDVNGILAMT